MNIKITKPRIYVESAITCEAFFGKTLNGIETENEIETCKEEFMLWCRNIHCYDDRIFTYTHATLLHWWPSSNVTARLHSNALFT